MTATERREWSERSARRRTRTARYSFDLAMRDLETQITRVCRPRRDVPGVALTMVAEMVRERTAKVCAELDADPKWRRKKV